VINDHSNKDKMIIEQKGQGRVKMVYNVKTKVGYQNIAGCAVTKGKMNKKYKVRVIREGEEVAKDCTVHQLKHFKDDV
jgi:translation initiation factor IF-2